MQGYLAIDDTQMMIDSQQRRGERELHWGTFSIPSRMRTFQVGVPTFITIAYKHTQTQGYTVCRIQDSGDTGTEASARVHH